MTTDLESWFLCDYVRTPGVMHTWRVVCRSGMDVCIRNSFPSWPQYVWPHECNQQSLLKYVTFYSQFSNEKVWFKESIEFFGVTLDSFERLLCRCLHYNLISNTPDLFRINYWLSWYITCYLLMLKTSMFSDCIARDVNREWYRPHPHSPKYEIFKLSSNTKSHLANSMVVSDLRIYSYHEFLNSSYLRRKN